MTTTHTRAPPASSRRPAHEAEVERARSRARAASVATAASAVSSSTPVGRPGRGLAPAARSTRRTVRRRTAAPTPGTGSCRTGRARPRAGAGRATSTPGPSGPLFYRAGCAGSTWLARWHGDRDDPARRSLGGARRLGARPRHASWCSSPRPPPTPRGSIAGPARRPELPGIERSRVRGGVDRRRRSPCAPRSTPTPTSRSPSTWPSTCCSRSSPRRCSRSARRSRWRSRALPRSGARSLAARDAVAARASARQPGGRLVPVRRRPDRRAREPRLRPGAVLGLAGTRSSTPSGSAPRSSTGGRSSASTRARTRCRTASACCRCCSRCPRCRSSRSRSTRPTRRCTRRTRRLRRRGARPRSPISATPPC